MTCLRPLWRLVSSLFLFALLANISPTTACAQEKAAPYRLTAKELQIYQQARTVMDWTTQEALNRSELKTLQPVESQQDLAGILQKVGENLEALFDNFPNTACIETVQSQDCSGMSDLNMPVERAGPLGMRVYDTHTDACKPISKGRFHYMLLPHSEEGGQSLNEYRTNEQGDAVPDQHVTFGTMLEPHRGNIVSTGLASVVLNFYPVIRTGCRFRYFGRQMLNGQETDVVGFAQIPKADAHATVAILPNGIAGLLIQGLAWIDASSHEILRIQTDLLARRRDMDLDKETTVIDFGTVHLAETSTTLRLPTKIVVDTKVHSQHFRNIHEYSDFKLFRVESHIGPSPER
jgi:hypothetical protein